MCYVYLNPLPISVSFKYSYPANKYFQQFPGFSRKVVEQKLSFYMVVITVEIECKNM